ncbi:MAG: class I SAM-dependent methyltransferase [Bacteroidota bacterium]|jgi:ubiquinone/menaquinone biosynthesis C-methylase UbiE
MGDDAYIKGLQADKEKTHSYYTKSLAVKTEQQKMLEGLLQKENKTFESIADVACGGGTLSFHLQQKYPNANFTLVDFNPDAIEIAKLNNPHPNFKFIVDSIYELQNLKDNSFDLVCCWQTLSWLDDAEKALSQLLRIVKPGGKIFASSLFNLDKDVDLFTNVLDHTHESGKQGIYFNYNTFSKKTISTWLYSKVKQFDILPFNPQMDFHFEGRGIGTYTVKTEKGERIQISAGMLMNWGILVIEK